MQTEPQHARPPYHRREGSTNLWVFCVVATTKKQNKKNTPARLCSHSFFPPVITLLSFICRVHAKDHSSRQWRHYLSGAKEGGKTTKLKRSRLEHGVQKGRSGKELWLLAEEYPRTRCRDCCFDYYSVYLSGDDDDIPLVTVIKMLCAVTGMMLWIHL